MAHQSIGFDLTMVLLVIFWTSSTTQTECSNTIITMFRCLNYIIGASSKPASGCCTQLSSVVRSKPECLCQVINDGGSSIGIQVNQLQAQALPAACNVQAPPLHSCNITPPTGSPARAPNSPINATSSGNGSNTTLLTGSGSSSSSGSSTGSDSSDGSSTKKTASLLVLLVFVASTFTI